MKFNLRTKVFLIFFVFLVGGGTVWYLNFNTYRLLTRNFALLDTKGIFLSWVLETRRYEKNYFLTRQHEHLVQALEFLNRAQGQLPQIDSRSTMVRPSNDFSKVQEALLLYRDALMRLKNYYDQRGEPGPDGEQTKDLQRHQADVRYQGNALTTDAEMMLNEQQRKVAKLLARKRGYHFIALAEIMGLCAFTILFLVYGVSRPLKVLEKSINKIVKGDYENIPPMSMGDEFEALVSSLNHMLSELNRRTEQLIQSRKMASLGILTSGVAHELNNPLNNISTSVQILLEELDEGDTEYQRQQLEEVEKQVERSKDIVKALLEFSRDTDYSMMSVRISHLVDSTIKLIRGETPGTVEIKTDVPETIQADMDPRQIQQVLINLVTNGIQAMTEGGVLSIRAFESPDEPGVCIQVEDSGAGIPRENLPKIFDPFFSTKDVGRGTGLGLSVSHGIVKKHGGRIEVKSEPGRGSTFTVFLPHHPVSREA